MEKLILILLFSTNLMAQEVLPVFPPENSGPRVEEEIEEQVEEVVTRINPKNIKSCRELIVLANKLLGNEIDPQSFSSTTFEELNMTIEAFNILSYSEQKVIYEQIMPIENKIIQTKELINSVGRDFIMAIMSGYASFEDYSDLMTINTKLDSCEI
jgi:hypothetical protein